MNLQHLLTYCSLVIPKQLANSADPAPKNAASDQALHGLRIVQPFSLGIAKSQSDVPIIEIRLIQYIAWESLFSIQ